MKYLLFLLCLVSFSAAAAPVPVGAAGWTSTGDTNASLKGKAFANSLQVTGSVHGVNGDWTIDTNGVLTAAPAGGTTGTWRFGAVTANKPRIAVDGTGYDLLTSASAANPTASIGSAAVNGSASTFMRSDAAPALGSVGTAGTYGDSTHFPVITTDAKGRVTSVTTNAITAVPTAANPTATIGTSAVNGSASTFMRSDAAPALGSVGTAGIYGDVNHFPVVTTDAAGRVTTVTTNQVENRVLTMTSTAYASPYSCDVAAANPNIRLITGITGALTITTANKAAGHWATIILDNSLHGSSSALTLPSWHWLVSPSTAPTSVAANKIMTITVFFTDGTDAGAIAQYAAEP